MTPAPWLARLRQRHLTPVTLIRLVPITVVLAAGLVLTTWTHGLLSQHRDLVVHAREVIETAKDVLIGMALLLTRFAVESHLIWRKKQSAASQGA